MRPGHRKSASTSLSEGVNGDSGKTVAILITRHASVRATATPRLSSTARSRWSANCAAHRHAPRVLRHPLAIQLRLCHLCHAIIRNCRCARAASMRSPLALSPPQAQNHRIIGCRAEGAVSISSDARTAPDAFRCGCSIDRQHRHPHCANILNQRCDGESKSPSADC